MKHTIAREARYRATDLLKLTVDEQGRRPVWMGDQIGIGQSHVHHILAGRRTLSEADARTWSLILGVPFFALFELAERSEILAKNESQETTAA